MSLAAPQLPFATPRTLDLGSKARLCPAGCGRLAEAMCPHHGVATMQAATGLPLPRPQPGEVVANRYRVLRELGRGGHGTIYAAEHLYGLGRVALKVLHGDDLSDRDLLRFAREGQVTARLKHPNIVQVLDFGQTDAGAPYLALELLEGCTLQTELTRREGEGDPLRQDEVLALADALLSGLAVAHAAGLVHRDLKPSNLFLAQEHGQTVPKILDFGIAHLAGSDLTHAQHVVGTPAYMSPEQCTAGETVDGRSDLYALAVVLYRCFCGALPFESNYEAGQLWAHVHTPAPDVAAHAQVPLSPAVVATIARALAKSPSERPATAAAMAALLHGREAEPSLPPPRLTSGGFTPPVRAEFDPDETPYAVPPLAALAPQAEPAPHSAAGASPPSSPAKTRWPWLGGLAVVAVAVLLWRAGGAAPAALAPAAVAHSAPQLALDTAGLAPAPSAPPVALPSAATLAVTPSESSPGAVPGTVAGAGAGAGARAGPGAVAAPNVAPARQAPSRPAGRAAPRYQLSDLP